MSFIQNLKTLYPDFVYKESEECIEQLMNYSNTVTVKLFSKFVHDCFLSEVISPFNDYYVYLTCFSYFCSSCCL